MSLLVELADLIHATMVGIDEISRNATYSRNTDLVPFIEGLEDAVVDDGPRRCGDDAFCLGEAVLVFAVEPLLTPEGKGLADVAVDQLGSHGVTIERVGRRFQHVLAVTGTTRDGALESRILASRGWVFLVMGPEQDVQELTALLDARIATFEAPSAG
jgi:hypothetical protein